MTSTYARESNERAGQSSNWAKDNSRVGAQIGSASTVYLDVKFYDVRSDDPPEKKYDVALKFLDGGNPRRAEELIKEAVGAGFLTDSGISGRISRNHVAYHLALAVLSGRSFSDLGPGEIASLVRAKELADRRRPDEWFDAFVVIRDLVECLERQEYSGRADPEFDRVLLAYRMLKDDARREHIQRHLDMMLAGGIADRLEEKTAEDVRNQRMSNDRKRRVPLFFEAVPEPPRPKTPEIPVLSRSARVVAACAAMVISAGLVLCVRVVLGESVLAAVVVVGLLAGGGYAAARFGLARFAARGRLADQEREYNRHYPVTRYSVAGWDRGHHEVTGNELRDAETGPAEGAKGRRRAFRRQVPRYVESQFTEHAPDRPWERRKWQADTAGIEVTLEKEILDLYSEPATEPYAVDWLIAWRVRQIARRWRDGRLHDYRDRLRVPAEATAGFVAGVAGLVLGAVIALLEMFAAQVGAALILVLVVAFGGWLLARSRIDVYLVRRRRLAADEADAGQRLRDERQEYQRWLEVLTDRPADDDMARWLDYDKSYLKKLAMNQYGLANRDVVAHAVLTEAGANASGARVTFGPPRYTTCVVTVFLLTAAGVRHVACDLDFATGLATDQRRMSYRYDAISSAEVDEIGVRFDDGHRHVVLPEGDRAGPGGTRSLILRQAFRLSFVDGSHIDVSVGSLGRDFFDRVRENPLGLFELARDTSGITAALRVLEAVAAEGRDWIVKERARRRQRMSDFQERLGTGKMLERAGETPADTAGVGGGDNGGNGGNGGGATGPASAWRRSGTGAERLPGGDLVLGRE